MALACKQIEFQETVKEGMLDDDSGEVVKIFIIDFAVTWTSRSLESGVDRFYALHVALLASEHPKTPLR